jgi:RNA polymerase sigma-70 factor (ECF subfamily)
MTSQANESSVDGLVLAFNEVRAELVSTLSYMLGNHADAQDAAQEAFLKCWRARNSVADVRNLRAWIFRVGVNAAKDLQRNAWYRRARPLAGPALNNGSPNASPVEAAQDLEMRDRLRTALLSLRPEEKEVFLLRENGDLTYEEIAQMRRCPVGTIKTQMRTAIRKLREVLQEK